MQLRLQTITIHNFKSYRGTHVVGGLDPSLTAVIGPNGSGKSNVIDSILFVLGFRARKMRHSSVAGLVYNGDGREEMCYVELEFNKFRIRREAHVSGRSRYFVDGDESSVAGVCSLLSSEGVDMEHNRFLILQGEIESIGMMRPVGEGLLEYIEDVIGSSRYKGAIEENMLCLRGLEEEYETKAGTLRFYQREYQHAEERRDEAVQAVEKRIRFLGAQRRFLEVMGESHRRMVDRGERDREEVSREIAEIRKRNEERTERLRVLEARGREARNVLRQVESEYLEAKRQYQRADRERSRGVSERDRLSREIRELSEELLDLRSKEEVRRSEMDRLHVEIEENNREISEQSVEAERIRREICSVEAGIKRRAEGSIQRIREGESLIMELLREKSRVGQEIGAVETEMEMLRRRRSDVECRMKEVDSQVEEILSRGKPLRGQSVVSCEIREIEKDLVETRREIARRMQRASEHREREERSSKESEVMSSIGGIPGVYGRLRELGRVEPRYEVALRAACRMLDSIVVDTTATAEECIRVMRRRNVGRATFIILDKIGEVGKHGVCSVPYLYMQVSCPEEFRKCFYFGLKDTVVCEDLESAERIGFGKERRRVVTMDGKVIEKSGVMSGGREECRVKRVDELERACRKMESLRESKEEELRMIREYERQGSLCEMRKDLGNEFDEIEKTLGGKDVGMRRREMEDLESRIEEAKRDVERARREVEDVTDGEIRRKREMLRGMDSRIEMLEKRNLELRMSVGWDGDGGVEEKEGEIMRKRDALQKIEIVGTCGLRELMDGKEDEYRSRLNEVTEIEEEVCGVKGSAGDEYHVEMRLRSKMEEIDERVEESGRQMRECSSGVVKCLEEIRRWREVSGVSGPEECGVRTEDMEDDEVECVVKRERETMRKMEKEAGGGGIDVGVFRSYSEARSEYVRAKEELEVVKGRLDGLRSETETLRRRRQEEFMEGFGTICRHLKEIYRTITCGGNAELELVDYLDPFSEGIVLSVMPPKKSWKNVSNLSGGEKTLSSLALIFALHRYRPSPFYVMDEIDAALDYRNVNIVSNYIKEMSCTSQFLVVSLRNDMFELSNTLLGVYKTNNVSRFLVVDVRGLELD